MEKLKFKEFADKYCETQESSPAALEVIFKKQIEQFQPEGWFLGQCNDLWSSRKGNQVILPYGPNNTYKELPANNLFRPHEGHACTYSVVAVLSREDFDAR